MSINNFIPDYCVYTDGACIDNGKENAHAGYGIFFGINDPRNVSSCVNKNEKQTNNTGELMGLIKAFDIIKPDLDLGKKIEIYSDSIYAIRCATEYGDKMSNCEKKKDIPNKELVKLINEIYLPFRKQIKFTHIKAHTNLEDIHSIGNSYADKLAEESISQYIKPKVYLTVEFSLKDKIKNLGGMWDANKKKWYIYNDSKNKNKIYELLNKYI